MLFIMSLVYNLKSLVCLVADVPMQEKKYQSCRNRITGGVNMEYKKYKHGKTEYSER